MVTGELQNLLPKARLISGLSGARLLTKSLLAYPKISTAPTLLGNSLHFQQTLSTSAPHQQEVGRLPHFRESRLPKLDVKNSDDRPYLLPHPIWSDEDVSLVEITHEAPQGFVEKLAYRSVQTLRVAFDTCSMYKVGRMDESKWLTRIIMLETVAGVPGMVGGMTRHFHSLRRLTRDHGWIHTLLEEAENERMHLMTALDLKQPGIIFRGFVILSQGLFVNLFFLAYLLSPRFCHKFVGYLEEEAVKTYTYCLQSIDDGKLSYWQKLRAPLIARNYWKLSEHAMMRDVILAIRADEAHHRLVNHTLAATPSDHPNPFLPGQKKL